MRILVILILLAFGLVTEGKTQRLNDAKTQSKDSATLCLCDSASYYESQIRIADSLYKNYLPQYNFEEVKAVMEFFDSYQPSAISGQRWRFFDSYQPSDISGQRWRFFGKEADDGNRLIAESRQLTAAKAHYYHAVGLTEKDDVVGTCEHYLIALEIMEDMMAKDKRLKAKVDNPEEYEKIRFVHLIHTRLAELFLDEGYYNFSISNNKKALYYSYILDDNIIKSRTHKYLGNAYHMLNKIDSALYYYKESLSASADIANKLDVDKCIAQIMYFDKAECDSAFMMLKNNLNKIDNEIVKYAYHHTIGNMYYKNKEYDSALYYLEESLDNNIVTQKLAFTTTLSAIYDSLGNYEKRSYYDNISTKLFRNSANKEVDKSQLQVLYNDYNERKAANEKAVAKSKARNKILIIFFSAIVVVILVIIYIKYNHRKQNNKLKKEIDDYVKENKQLIEDFQKTNSKKDRIIKQQKKEISEIKNQLNKKSDIDIDAYYNSEICKNISGRKEYEFTPLTNEELTLLLKAADNNLGNISSRLCEQMPSLNKNDIYTICLIILNIEKNKFPYLLGRDRKTIYDRLNKIKTQMNLGPKQDLFIHIRDTYLN